MKHLGDITKITAEMTVENGMDIPDVLFGGSPCQDLSCAGLRKGMLHSSLGNEETTRSGLFMEQVRITKELREYDERVNRRTDNLTRPRYFVWENVPGALTSGTPHGADFHAVLEEISKIKYPEIHIPRCEKWPPSGCIVADGFSLAWRIFDSQYWRTPEWNTPQRRKRLSLVADFGGQTAPQILFEQESLPWDIDESGETWEEPEE